MGIIGRVYLGTNQVYGAPYVPPFTPAQIAKYWWTADAGVTESGGAVSAWVDQVGGLSIDQATSANQPTLTTSTNLNNQSVIRFDRTNSEYLQRSPISTAADGYQFTSIVITDNTAGTTTGAALSQAYLGPPNGRLSFRVSNSNVSYLLDGFINPPLGEFIDVETPATTGAKVMAYEYDGSGNSKLWFNDFNTPYTTVTGGPSNQDLIQSTTLIFGGYNDTSTGTYAPLFYTGDIAEVIFVPSTLSAGDITNLQTYINTKYNLSV